MLANKAAIIDLAGSRPLALGTRAMGDENTREFIRKFDARW
jgi:hypothetical protein